MGTAGYGTVVNCALPLVKDQRVIYQCAVHGDIFLMDWVRSEVEKNARFHKALRLARDERDAEPPGGGKRGGRNQRKKGKKEGE